MFRLHEIAALAFTRGYSFSEMMVVFGLFIVVACLLGLLANAILGARGFGIFGNAGLVGAGIVIAILIHNWLSRMPDFNALGLPDRAIVIALAAACATTVLLGAAYAKRTSAS